MTYIHNISPIMLEVFGIKLYWYGFMYAISFVIIDYLIVSASKNKNIDLELENWKNLKSNSEKMSVELNDRKKQIKLFL